MSETRAVGFLRVVSLFAVGTAVVAGVVGRGDLSRAPSRVQDVGVQLAGGLGDGYMGLVVVAVLLAPPVAMLMVALEGRATRPRYVWIAVATLAILITSAAISASTK